MSINILQQAANQQASTTYVKPVYNYGYFPLLKGDTAPTFTLNNQSFITFQHFLDMLEPIVLVFYGSFHASIDAIPHLKQLQAQVQQSGGNLIILTNTSPKEFKKITGQLNNLNVFNDTDNSIATQFGLYDEANPLNNWLSGIEEENAILPALYVIAPDRSIIYHHIDYVFDLFNQPLLPKQIIEPLLEAVDATYENYTFLHFSYNKLVS